MTNLDVNLDLVRKYDIPGPRYTSYPSALHFSEDIRQKDIFEQIKRNNESNKPISLYFHLPFCYSLCWFCGCTQVITKNQDKGPVYMDYLDTEMKQMAPYINDKRSTVQMHWGGGTPTFLRPEEIRDLGERIHSYFNFTPDAEVSVEVDPRRLTNEHVQALHSAGFNRASLGVQDVNPEVQKAVHRIQSDEQNENTIKWLREEDFQSINIDLIYGLPHQTAESFDKTLDAVLEYDPDRFAVFNYAHVPWVKPAQKLLDADALPAPEEKLAMLKLIIERLTRSGYVYIGMDHFAKLDDELTVAQRNKELQRNFQGYSTYAGTDIYAFGMSSISQVEDVYYQNTKNLQDYYNVIDQHKSPIMKGYILSDDDMIRRQTIMQLMCDMELNFNEMSDKLYINFRDYFGDILNNFGDMESDGLLSIDDNELRVTTNGRLFIRNIAMKFDAYIKQENTDHKYSHTV